MIKEDIRKHLLFFWLGLDRIALRFRVERDVKLAWKSQGKEREKMRRKHAGCRERKGTRGVAEWWFSAVSLVQILIHLFGRLKSANFS